MSKRVRNISAVAGIIAYCLFALAFAALPSARDVALVVLGLLEIGISVAYLLLNRPVARKELRTELIGCGVILMALAFVVLQYRQR